jgi:hypothetical protein
MSLLPPLPDPVPFDDVAAVLGDAAAGVRGGPPAVVTATGRQLAGALGRAGYRLVREEPAPQLTL